jgi:DNA-binding SARP family transcriptional activator
MPRPLRPIAGTTHSRLPVTIRIQPRTELVVRGGDGGVRFRLLGALQVRTEAGWTTVRAEQQRVVLAVLLTDPGRTVAARKLVDELWGERPPRTALNTVHAYVGRLRRLLGDGVLLTRGRGYELVLGPDDVDVAVFERLVASGREALGDGRPEVAADQLSHALALWRGPVLADVPECPSLVGWATSLERARLDALEDRVTAALELGRHAEVLDELRRLTSEQPLRERLWHNLMLALHRCGRRAEALDVYRCARQALVTELGLEPGRDLRELHRVILTEDDAHPSTAIAVPAQLPADVRAFTGRIRQLECLDAVLPAEGDGTAGAVVISAVSGFAGVGKTALAVHWAHRVRGRFPDGQLYANLRGYAAEAPVRPIESLARFLQALDVPAERIPSDVDTASALYRSLLADRRVLVLLDNASDPDQVRPLLPGGPGCAAVVTSRDHLGGLVARDGAVPLRLDVLTDDEACDLLAHLLGEPRVAAEPRQTADLAALCGNLPLALRIAAANLVARPHSTIEDHVHRLRENRLDRLRTHDDGVRDAFDQSYDALPDDARRLFRLLGLVPGTDITVPAAAALAGATPAEADDWLDRLATAHLVDEHAPGRYACHDLLRRYAAERAVAAVAEESRNAALDRFYAYYTRTMDAVAASLYAQTIRLPYQGERAEDPIDAAAAAAWIDAERANLVAIVVRCAGSGPRRVAWWLADAMRGYLLTRASTVDWQTVAEAGLAAAEADGDPAAMAAAHLSLGGMHLMRGHIEATLAADFRAVDLAARAGWAEGEAVALGNTGIVYLTQGRLAAAAPYLARSLEMHRRTGRFLQINVFLQC